MELLSLLMTLGIVCLSTFGGLTGDIINDKSNNLGEETEFFEIDQVVGLWNCEQSVFGKSASAEIYATIKKNGDVRIWGIANSLKHKDYHYNLYGKWKHNDGNSYTLSVLDKNIEFYCDGDSIVISGNPVKLGFTNSKMVNSNFKLDFKKIDVSKNQILFDLIYRV